MADVTPIRTAAETALLALFPAMRASLPGAPGVASLREAAFARFAEAGLPHRRVESWKYTDLRALLREAAPPAQAPDAAALEQASRLLGDAGTAFGPRLVLVDGAYAPSLSSTALPAGLRVRSLSQVLASGETELLRTLAPEGLGADDAVLSLNTALMTDGIVVEVEAGAAISDPVEIVSVVTAPDPRAIVTRSALVLGAGATATLVESHLRAPAQRNTATVLVAGDGASLTHVVQFGIGPQREAAEGSHVLQSTLARLGAQARFTALALTEGLRLVRNQVFLAYEGEGATATIGGAALLNGRQHADTTLVVDHAVPHCESRELFKHVLDGESTGVFQGKIIVRPDAQKTDGRMMSQAVLLRDGATMNNKPELEIFADDVQCAHGATCGELDEDLLFYLRARGLPKPEAEALMLQAFVGEAIALVEHEGLRERLDAVVERWLQQRH